jgi:hypothetical protein
MDFDDQDDLPGYSTVGDLDQFDTAEFRLHRSISFPWITLATFNPVTGEIWTGRVAFRGIDRLEARLQERGLLTYSSTRWRDVQRWVDRRTRP